MEPDERPWSSGTVTMLNMCYAKIPSEVSMGGRFGKYADAKPKYSSQETRYSQQPNFIVAVPFPQTLNSFGGF